MNRWCCLFLLLCCVVVPRPRAQTTNATISGGISDPSGKMIQGADIYIVNDATGIIYRAKSNAAGIYLVPVLPPGTYHVQVSKPGFTTIIKPDVVLNVQTAMALNFALPVGATSESITVDASSSLLNTTDASVSTVVDLRFVQNIPLNGRSFQDLISMTPGVVNQTPQDYGAQIVGEGGEFSINGQRTESNYYTVDGITANISSGNGGGVGSPATGGTLAASTALGTTQTLVPIDALQEFRIQSSSYSAEFGGAPGGQFSLVTRSGSNRLHGSLFEYLRNNDVDANDWFNDHYGEPAPALRQNDFGGTFSGPLTIPRLYNGRDHSFFFFAYEGLRLDQPVAATVQYVPDTYLRQQAVAAMQPILNAFPLPNGIDYGTSANPSLAQFIQAYSLPSALDSFSVRVDHNLSPKLMLFFRAGVTPSHTASRPNFTYQTNSINAQTYTLGANSQFTDHLSNEFRLGYARSDSSEIGTIDNFGGATPTNLAADIGAGSFQQVVPAINFEIDGIGAPLLATNLTSNLSRQWNLVDTVSLLASRHSIKCGFDYRHIKSVIAPPQIEPYAVFLDPQTILSGTPDIPLIVSFAQATPLFHHLAFFAQDNWRPHPRLSLSYGVRWEYSPPPTEQHGNDAFTILGSLADPANITLAPRGTPLWHASRTEFAPRLGGAWTVQNRSGFETILRAGGGAYFDTANSVASNGFSGLGFFATSFLSNASIPYTADELNQPISTAAPYTSATVYAYPSHLQMPYTLEWNVSTQQALGRDQALTLSYVGAAGRRLLALQELNLSSLNPNFGAVDYLPSGVTSNYQAFELQFQRTVAKGLQALASYTWSHAIDFGSESAETVLQRGNADFDVRHNFQVGVTWDLPGVATDRGLGYVLNHWGADLRLFARTAYPLTLYGNFATDPNTGNQFNGGLDLVPNEPVYLYGSTYPGGKAINPAAFAIPVNSLNGNAPRNFVRGFGMNQLNLALRRDFPIHEDLVLHFRAETFNLLNHPNFGYVDTNYTDAQFGQATQMLNASLGTLASQYQQGGPRSMQFALRLTF